jgi:hypothetical protein
LGIGSQPKSRKLLAKRFPDDVTLGVTGARAGEHYNVEGLVALDQRPKMFASKALDEIPFHSSRDMLFGDSQPQTMLGLITAAGNQKNFALPGLLVRGVKDPSILGGC